MGGRVFKDISQFYRHSLEAIVLSVQVSLSVTFPDSLTSSRHIIKVTIYNNKRRKFLKFLVCSGKNIFLIILLNFPNF